MDSYFKTYEDDLYFFIPMTSRHVDGTFSKIEAYHNQVEARLKAENRLENSFGKIFCEALNEHVRYECNSKNLSPDNLCRFYLGEFRLPCYDDNYNEGEVFDVETAHIFITAHRKTGLHIITVAIPNNHYIPTQLIDQMSSGHLDIYDGDSDVIKPVAKLIGDMFNLTVCGDPKFVICLSNEPKDITELGYMLSGETYVSEHIDYHILPEHIEKLLVKNHASYDYYKSFISKSGIAFILKDFSEDLRERIWDVEASVLFVVGFVLLQNTAVLRTNRNVVAQLESSDEISYEDIEKLYMEFGKTMKFWNSDIYKYPFSQREADEVIEAFGISETIEEYHRNQQYLDRLIDLKISMAERESDTMMNYILYALSCFEASSISLSALIWLLKTFADTSASYYPTLEIAARVGWVFLFFGSALSLLAFISVKFLKRKKIKKRERENRKRK